MNDTFTINRFFNELKTKKIVGNLCKNCGKVHLPARPICDQCNSQDLEFIELSGKGFLQAYSVVYVTTTKMGKAGFNRENPNCVGIVKLEEGPMISSEIYGFDLSQPEKIKIGTTLHAKFIEREEGDVLAFEA